MATITVYHSYYGCETGCCGHIIRIDDEEVSSSFEFSHPYGDDKRRWAEEFITEHLGAEHVKDLDWENSIVSDD